MQSFPVAQTLKELLPLPDDQAPLLFLPPPIPGYSCLRCVLYKATNFKNVRAHLNTEYEIFNNPSIITTNMSCLYRNGYSHYGGKGGK